MHYDDFFITIQIPFNEDSSSCFLKHPFFWQKLNLFVKIVKVLEPQRWFVRVGTQDGENGLRLAREYQSINEYCKERLAHPALSFSMEQQKFGLLLNKYSQENFKPFLEIVMGFSISNTDPSKYLNSIDTIPGQDSDKEQWEICILHKPEDLICHTPLNQRLLIPNFELCHFFTIMLCNLEPKQKNIVDQHLTLGISIAAFRSVCHFIRLQKQHQNQILTFGRYYLAQYLEIPETDLNSDPSVYKRVDALSRFETKARSTALGESQLDLSDFLRYQWIHKHAKNECFFFPESFWMQYHWFNNLIGLNLLEEVTLIDAMMVASKDS